MLRTMTFRAAAMSLALAAAVGCSDDEEPATGHGSPVSVRLFEVTGGAELTEPMQLPAGGTTRVEVRYYDADGALLNPDIEADHYTSLTFSPTTFATVAEVTGARFQRDVTVTAAGGAAASVAVGYGHDAAADEKSFGPFDVTAVAAGLRAAAR